MQVSVEITRGTAFEQSHHIRKPFSFPKLYQPMEMIRHQYPGKGVHKTVVMELPHPLNHNARAPEICKPAFAPGRTDGEVVDLSGYGNSAL